MKWNLVSKYYDFRKTKQICPLQGELKYLVYGSTTMNSDGPAKTRGEKCVRKDWVSSVWLAVPVKNARKRSNMYNWRLNIGGLDYKPVLDDRATKNTQGLGYNNT